MKQPVYYIILSKQYNLTFAFKLNSINFSALTIFSFNKGCGSSKVLELSDKFLDVRKDGGQWFVMFYAPWCGHCKRLEPIWAHVAQALYKSNVRVGRVDCTRFPNVANEFSIVGFPTVKLYVVLHLWKLSVAPLQISIIAVLGVIKNIHSTEIGQRKKWSISHYECPDQLYKK